MTALLTGLALGVAGSGHCAGMCGPLVVTIGRGLARPSRGAQLRHALLYHAGRTATYLALALPLGLAGELLSRHGLGRFVALAAGALLLIAAARSVRPRLLGPAAALAAAAAGRACATAIGWGRSHSVAGPVLTGAANGLLPCGLVYAAVAASAAAGRTTDSLLLMLGFGLGTAPALVAIGLSAAWLPPAFRQRLRHLAPVVLVATALLLVLRAFGH